MSAFPVPVGPLYGALFLATIMCTAFYGVVCMQTFFYYIHYQNDPSRTKIFVAILWAVNTLHEGLVVSGTYKYIMAGLENPASFIQAIPELVVQLVLTIPVALPAQGFFVYRIYVFSNESLVAPLVWLPFAIYQLVASVIYVSKTLYMQDGVVHVVPLSTIGDPFITAISVSYCSVVAGVDISISIFLTYLITRKRISTSFKRTARILERLTVFAVNSGIWTAIFSLLNAILVHVESTNLIYAVFFIPLCSIYCNTVLANLNGRMYIMEDRIVKDPESIQISNMSSNVRFPKQNTCAHARLVSCGTDPVVWKTTEVVTVSEIDNQDESRNKSNETLRN